MSDEALDTERGTSHNLPQAAKEKLTTVISFASLENVNGEKEIYKNHTHSTQT